ncbi:hypothetical protein EDD11_001716 [Mortierella claussenii]|nr:hypothetical protein EDD11_001716 [Mortierella claussenii]
MNIHLTAQGWPQTSEGWGKVNMMLPNTSRLSPSLKVRYCDVKHRLMIRMRFKAVGGTLFKKAEEFETKIASKALPAYAQNNSTPYTKIATTHSRFPVSTMKRVATQLHKRMNHIATNLLSGSRNTTTMLHKD